MSLRVAYTRGMGTGKELANVFERAMLKLSTYYSVLIDLRASSSMFHDSCFPPHKDYDHPKYVEEEKTSQDALLYEDFLRAQAAQGTNVVYQNAIDAQSLRLVRQRLQAVSIECFDQRPNSLLLVRNQSQGFYNGSNRHDISEKVVSRSCQFSKELTNRIVVLSVERARHLWGDGAITSISMVYDSHPFNGVFNSLAKEWSKEWSKEYGTKIDFVHSDTVNKDLLAFGIRGRQILIVGNDWVDIMTGNVVQGSKCTETVYLHPDVYPLSEYHAVHDPATSGKEPLNPVPTIRTAASVLARHAGCRGIEAAMDLTLLSLRRRHVLSSDDRPRTESSTMEIVDCIVDTMMAASLAPGYMGLLQTLGGGGAVASSVAVKEQGNGVLPDGVGGQGG